MLEVADLGAKGLPILLEFDPVGLPQAPVLKASTESHDNIEGDGPFGR